MGEYGFWDDIILLFIFWIMIKPQLLFSGYYYPENIAILKKTTTDVVVF